MSDAGRSSHSGSSASTRTVVCATRPDVPVQCGKSIDLVTNLGRMLFSGPELVVTRYGVKILQEKKRRDQPSTWLPLNMREDRRRAFWWLVYNHPSVFRCVQNMVYDDFEMAWSLDQIRPPGDAPVFETTFPLLLTGGRRPSTIGVSIQFIDTLNVQFRGENRFEANRFLKNLLLQQMRFPGEHIRSLLEAPVPDETVVFDRLRDLQHKYQPISGRIYVIPRAAGMPRKEISPALEAWAGLYMSIRETKDYNTVVNFGLVNRLFYKMEFNLVEVWDALIDENFGRRMQIDPADTAMNREQRMKFNERMGGVMLKSSSDGALCVEKDGRPFLTSDRHFKLICLAGPESTITASATKKDFEKFDYKIVQMGFTARTMVVRTCNGARSLEELYGRLGVKKLEYPNLPLVKVKSGANTSYLPMEVLMTHDTPQVYKKMLNFETRMKFIRAVSRDPTAHLRLTNHMSGKTDMDSDPFLQEFGIRVDTENIECTGKVLIPPIIASDNADEPNIVPQDRDHRGFSLREFLDRPQKTIKFAVILTAMNSPADPKEPLTVVSGDDANLFMKQLIDVCRIRGMVVAEEYDKKLWYPNCEEPLEGVAREVLNKFEAEADESSILAFIVITKRNLNLYGEVKGVMNGLGVVSQVVDCSNVLLAINDKERIFFNISMKLNAKLGGVTHGLSTNLGGDAQPEEHNPGLEFLKKNNETMFIGIDVTHPTSESGLTGLSIASLVGSVNKEATRYKMQVVAQMNPKETIVNFDVQLQNLLKEYVEHTHCQPRHLVILRDGVSDSELMNTASAEINWIKNAWRHVVHTREGEKDVTVTYVVVQKRHHVRFYLRDTLKMRKAENVPSGTCVDTAVVSPDVYDFFLASHHGAIGTSRPGRYIVLYDEWNLDCDQMVEMVYNLCFVYARCCHPVSLPAPLYYAHLACEQLKEIYKYHTRAGNLDERPETPASVSNSSAEFQERQKIEKKLASAPSYPGMSFV